MGYYTNYEISCDQGNIGEYNAAAEIESLSWTFDGGESARGNSKWYDYEPDMEALSRLFPGVLFTLKGEGEESGDIWELRAKGGTIQKRRAEVVIPPFDEAFT